MSKTTTTKHQVIWTLSLLIFLSLTAIQKANAESLSDTFTITKFQTDYNLNTHLEFLEDRSGELGIKALLDRGLTEFQKSKPELNKDYSYWVKVVLQSKAVIPDGLDWNLYLGNPEYAKVYVLDINNEIIDSTLSGSWRSLDKKNVDLEYKIQRVKVSVDFDSVKTLLIHYSKRDKHKHEIDLQLKMFDFYQNVSYFKKSRRDWLFLGFLITMIFFNLVFFASIRDRAFLYHALFILGVVILLMDNYGITTNIIFIKQHPMLLEMVNITGVLLLSVCYFQFIRSYLDLHHSFPKWDFLFRNIVFIISIYLVALIIYYQISFNEPLVDKLVAGGLFLIYIIGAIFIFTLFKNGDKKTYFLIIGTLFSIAALGLNAYAFIFDKGIWTSMTQLGIAGEIISFSIGLGFRFKHLKDEEFEAIRLKELSDFKSKVFNNISHEFRTPITLIQGLSEEIKDKVKRNEYVNVERHYNTIEKNCDELLDLVNQMLELSRLENNNYVLNVSTIEINDFLKNIYEQFTAESERKSIQFEYNCDMKNVILETDRQKLFTIIKNLLSNAFKFTPFGGKISLEGLLIDNLDNTCIQIKVTDSGVGISKEDLPMVFDRFYKVNDENRTAPGTGIGLSLVKELTNLLGGTVHAESEIAKGSRFSLMLPIVGNNALQSKSVDDKVLKSSTKELEAEDVIIEEKAVVLVVDDNEDIRHYLIGLLEKDYKVLTAKNGKEGLELALDSIPDLIITDVLMPVMNGIEFCREIKTNKKLDHIPVLMLTAKSSDEARLEGLKSGAEAYLSKPFKKDELMIRLKVLNETRQLLKEKFSQFSLLDEGHESLGKQSSFLIEVNDEIEAHIEDSTFNVQKLADCLHMSRMQLHRKLVALTKRSASNYVRTYRLIKAKPFLKDQSLNVSEVAWRVGFQDANYFTKSFIKEFEMSPSEYRERL